jgi:hypothetical protein
MSVITMPAQPIPIPVSIPSTSTALSHERPDTPRGRRSSAKSTPLSSSSGAVPPGSGSLPRPSPSDIYQTHHHLPPNETSLIPSSPILYLPPLLSPLPVHVSRQSPPRDGPSHEVLAEFATRLPDIDPASLDLHQALHHFRPLKGGYALEPYQEAFNWSELVCHFPSPHDSMLIPYW